jgi:hypothetical protein
VRVFAAIPGCSENQGFWDAPRTDESSAFASGVGVLPPTAAIDVNDLLDQGLTRTLRLLSLPPQKTKHMNALKNLYQNRDPLRLAYGKASGTMRGVLFDRASVLEVETDFACFVPMTCRQAAV